MLNQIIPALPTPPLPTPQTNRKPLLSIAAMMLSASCFAATETTSDIAQVSMAQTKTLPKVEAIGVRTPDGYRATTTTTTKTLQDPQDVPQALTTITQVLMKEQQVGALREALRNISGLTFNAAEGGRTGDNMMLRGFYTFGDLYLDGIRDTAQYNRETFYLEQIDVLRGAAAMLFGRGQAGGVINQVSKTPQRDGFKELYLSGGTQDYVEAKADINQPFGENHGLRVNLLHRDEGSTRTNPTTNTGPELHRSGIALSLGFNLGGSNEFNLNHVESIFRDVPDYGVAFDRSTRRVSTNFSANTFWGNGQNFDDGESRFSTVSHLHRFASGGQWRTQWRRADYARQYWAKTPSATLAPSPIGAVGGNQTRKSDYETQTLQSDFNNTWELAGMQHELLLGGEFMNEQSYRRALLNVGSLSAPVYHPNVENTALIPATFDGDTLGLYVQDSIEFVPHWKLMLGARHDALDATYSSLTAPALDFSEWSTRAGLSWQPDAQTHYYLTHSDSFSPTADLYQLSGASYPAETSSVLEAGAKWLLRDGDLAFRAALYRAEKDWERNTDLESTAAILTRKRRTDGLELELVGRITPNWQVFSGLALMDSKILEVAENRNATTGVITRADSRLRNQQARNAPDYTFNLWSTYAFSAQWKAGLGLESKGKRLVYSPASADVSALFINGKFDPNTAPSYVRWDAMIAYENADWALRLNLRNLTDEVYFDGLYDNGGFALPGTRRSAIFTAEYKF
jgi:catecholate siderophore receptor